MVLELKELEIDGTTDEALKFGAQRVIEFIRPSWSCRDICYKIYTDGITNKLIGAWNKLNKGDQILVRVYGKKTELFIDRNAETENIKLLYKSGCGPELYATFQNGLSYAFIPGIPLSSEKVREPRIWKAVGIQMAKLHNLKVEKKEAMLFRKMKSFIHLLPDSFHDDQTPRLELAGIRKEYIEEEMSFLEGILTALNSPIVFCHNDILLNNIIWNDATETANFIDYEYGAVNYQAFDIGNHFNEFAGIEIVDYNMYPDDSFQRDWLRNYLTNYYSCDENKVSLEEIEKWRSWVNKFALASHIFWGTWALLQASHSTIEFDFTGYAIIRFQEYKKRKNEFLNL